MTTNYLFNNLLVKPICLFIVAVFTINVTFAQTPISTPAQLKTACETSPGNIVTINQSTKIFLNAAPYTPEQVNCGCTIVVTNEASLEFELVNMKFAGAFAVQSAGKSNFKANKSLLTANSVAFNLGGVGSDFASTQSAINAEAGNLTVTLSPQSKFELYGYFNSQYSNGLSASGIVNISAGAQFTGLASGTGIRGLQGVQLNSSGIEGLLTLEATAIRALAGSASILLHGDKSKLTMIESYVFSKDNTRVELAGEETNIKMEEGAFSGPAYGVAMTGGVLIIAAGDTKNKGGIELVAIAAGSMNGSFMVTAADGGEDGKIKVEKSNISNIGGAILFSTGRKGSTEVKENYITSQSSITIRTGIEGNCVSTPNRALTAPIVNACVTALAAKQSRSSIANEVIVAGRNYTLLPNPGINGSIQVNFKNDFEAKNIVVTDLLGRQIKNWTNYRNTTLSINQLKQGFYNLKVMNTKSGEVISKSFMIAE
jgi:Secretion system C-terminal sorting domain